MFLSTWLRRSSRASAATLARLCSARCIVTSPVLTASLPQTTFSANFIPVFLSRPDPRPRAFSTSTGLFDSASNSHSAATSAAASPSSASSSSSPPSSASSPSAAASSSSSSSSPSSSSLSWADRLKSFFNPSSVAQPDTVADGFTMEKFADEMKKARRFGQLAQFGRGLPKGGETAVARSLERQEAIVRAMSPAERANPATELTAAAKQRVASEVQCSVADVDGVLEKYHWFKEAHRRVELLRAAGKPLPRSFQEVEALMGGGWSPKASRSLGFGEKTPSKNAQCPCGSKKKYKRCCGAPSQ